MIRKFFLKYQDRILFGSDGNPGAGSKIRVPHLAFLATSAEHFDHTIPVAFGHWRTAARPLAHIRHWLSDTVLRKVYYANALRYLPSARVRSSRQLAARR